MQEGDQSKKKMIRWDDKNIKERKKNWRQALRIIEITVSKNNLIESGKFQEIFQVYPCCLQSEKSWKKKCPQVK